MKKKHLWNLFGCAITAIIMVSIYFLTTDIRPVSIAKKLLGFMAVFAALFIAVEFIDLLCQKVIKPKLEENKYGTAWLIICLCCILFGIIVCFGFKLLKHNSELSIRTILQVLAISGIFFILVFIELKITQCVITEKKQGYRFTVRELIIALMCVTAFLIGFIPVAADYYHEQLPVFIGRGDTGVSVTGGDRTPVGEITKEKTVSQSFICSGYLSSIRLMGATYARTNHGTLHIELIDDETNELIQAWDLKAINFADNSWFTVNVDNPEAHDNKSNHRYRIDISSDDSTEGDALTLWRTQTDRYKKGTLVINGTACDGDLQMEISGFTTYTAYYEKVRIYLGLCLAIALNVMIFIIIQKRNIGYGQENNEKH